MAARDENSGWRIGGLAACGDVLVGLGVVAAGLTGHLGENWVLFTFGGAALAAGGLGAAIWMHTKVNQGRGRGGRQD